MTSEQKKRELVKTLNSNDVTADVIKLCAIMESRLDGLLAVYYGGTYRMDEFMDYIAPCISLPQKIRLLKNMKFHRPMKSVNNITSSLERLRKVRNKLAHTWHVSDHDVRKLWSDKELIAFILGYPQSFSKEKHILENSFNRLWQSWKSRNAPSRHNAA